MTDLSLGVGRRYPVRAILAVAGAGLWFVFNMVTGFLFMALVPPMIPVFVTILIGGACLLGNALKYAVRVSVPRPAAMLRAAKHDEKGQSRFAARAV